MNKAQSQNPNGGKGKRTAHIENLDKDAKNGGDG